MAGRRLVVTGASSGIGRAFALQAAQAGAEEVVLVARRAEELERVAEECARLGGRARGRAADLADPAGARRLAETILREHGPVDVLVSNAGSSIRRPVLDYKPEDVERLVAVNHLGPAALVLGLLPSLLERRGQIVQVSTIGTLTGAPNFASYVASKAAADHFLRSLRLELGGRGLAVTILHMPLVRTPMLAPSRIYEMFPALTVETAARRIGWAIVRRPLRVAPRWATALEILHALAPGLMQRFFTLGHEPLHGWLGRRLARRDRRRPSAPPADPRDS